MRNVFSPKWIIIINTIPTLILFMIYLGAYQIIKSLLSADSISLWLKFGATLACLAGINLLYAIVLIIRKKQIHALYGLLILLIYIPFIYAYGLYTDEIIPGNIPRWMLPENMVLYVGTFLMPTLAMALLTLVIGFTTNYNSPGGNFAVAILIPISWYVFFQIILPLWQTVESDFLGHVFVIFIIVGTLLFLFFLSRGVYILSIKKAERWRQYQFAMKIMIAIIFPLLGLALNQGLVGSFIPSNIFGDFSHAWFYILALVNGIIIVLPNVEFPLYRLILFVLRSITFPYVIYFFLVFLPYLPLSVLAIIAVGLGFLMLSPLILMILQSKILLDDFKYLYQNYSKPLVKILFVNGIIILPFIISLDYLSDKKALHAALDYVYATNYTEDVNKPIKIKALKRVIKNVQYHKDGRFGMLPGGQQPFLSPYYNWLVLDNLTLSNTKLDLLDKVFLGKKIDSQAIKTSTSRNIKITDVKIQSNYDTKHQAWRSWVDLEITNFDTVIWQNEFETTFELPEGAWISDYYLWVNDVKKVGILAEKKSATWVYEQIISTRKDPGILYYLSDNKIAFKIFPFLSNETRKTGFEILHKEPFQFNIDDHIISLGDSFQEIDNQIIKSKDENVIYVPTSYKKQLPVVKRTPYFHFIIDGSVHNKKFATQSIERIEALLSKNLLNVNDARFTITSVYNKTFNYSPNWHKELEEHHYTGGFYLERGIKQILLKHYKGKGKYYPILIIVSNDITNAILPKDFKDFNITFPESELFFELGQGGMLLAHSLSSNSSALLTSAKFSVDNQVFAYPDSKSPVAYLPMNNQPNIIITSTKPFSNTADLTTKSWDGALILHGKWLKYHLHPEEGDRAWLDIVKGSFAAHVMTPVTSFIVVENDAQEAALQAKQAKILASKSSLDLGEDTEQMSEPDFIFLLACLLPLLYFFKKRFI